MDIELEDGKNVTCAVLIVLTVQEKDYIVLLSKADYKTTIYSLSSKNHSLYSADRVNDYPELKVLYEKAREYTTDYREKTVSDYLREEWDAVEKNEDCYYFHESGASLYFDEAIYYLQGDDEFIRNLTEMIPDIGVCYYKDGQYCLNDLSEKAVISRKDDSLELIVEGKEKVIFSKTTDK